MTETELLFSEILNCSRADLYLKQNITLEKDQSGLIAAVLKRRFSGEPIQYILGYADFMGMRFKVTVDVLIPRPETELLVEKAIEIVRRQKSEDRSQKILDLGTGSGCIAISLAKYLPSLEITATDISQKALDLAVENAKINHIADRIVFLKSDLFDALALCPLRYALCVCNPPYIPSGEIARLQPEVQCQPLIALDGGRDGLSFYRRLARVAPRYLEVGGCLIMEMGFGQKNAIEKILRLSGNFRVEEIVKDYNNIERIVVAKRIA